MNAKEYLNQIRDLDTLIDVKCKKRAQLEIKAQQVSSLELKKPDDKKRVSRLSRKAIEWMKSYDDTTAIENLYPDYQLQKNDTILQ